MNTKFIYKFLTNLELSNFQFKNFIENYFLEKNRVNFWKNFAKLENILENSENLILSGSTRGIIFLENKNFVLKFNLYSEENSNFIEFLNFQKSKLNNLDKFFAKCWLIYYKKIPILVMKKLNIEENFNFEEFQDWNFNDYFKDNVYIFLKNFYKNDFKKLIDFCYKNHINDIHEENIGIDNKGFPKIIDYAGF